VDPSSVSKQTECQEATLGRDDLIVHLSQQPRDDFHILFAILVLLAVDLGRLCAALLLRLTRFDPLLHCKMLPKFGQVVVLQAKAVQQRAVGDGFEDNMVVGSGVKR